MGYFIFLIKIVELNRTMFLLLRVALKKKDPGANDLGIYDNDMVPGESRSIF